MKFRKVAGLSSLILFVLAIVSLSYRGLSLGLDFSGGTLVEIVFEETVPLEDVRSNLANNGIEDFQVVNFGTETDVLIKAADKDSQGRLGDKIYTILEMAYPNQELELKRIEFVGPQVGSELRDQGGLGMLVALGMILLYVAFRFQFKFAIGAVVALAHDVVIVLGIFSIVGWDFDLTVMAALLAVIGYSLNDTIVVSDRMRENFRIERGLEPVEIVDKSINQTLSRTLITSLTTLLVLFSLLIFGGELIKGFSLALILGIVVGTYSSIYVVANMLISMNISQEDLAVPEPEGAEFDDLP
ncbi:MAG: protein translocase subunit SecF [Gammaproteobacteria bacterium]